jgi:hypothetical protein
VPAAARIQKDLLLLFALFRPHPSCGHTPIIAILILLLAGIAYLCRTYGIAATAPGQTGYQTVLSQLRAAVDGREIFYFITMFATLVVLALAANTSFAGFSPRRFACAQVDQFKTHPITS